MPKNTSIKGNPGAQGSVGFGGAMRSETSNVVSSSLGLPQTIMNPGKGPANPKSGGAGPGMVRFGSAKVPKPAKNRAGFTTSD